MTGTSRNSALSDETDPASQATDNTSSQIFLSRGVAGAANADNFCSMIPQASYTASKEPHIVTVINRVEDGEMSRGRATKRALKRPDPLSKAESRQRSHNHAAIEVYLRPIKRHKHRHPTPLLTLSGPTDPSAAVDRSSCYAMKNTAAISNKQIDSEPPPTTRMNKFRESKPLQPALTVSSPSWDPALRSDRSLGFTNLDFNMSSSDPENQSHLHPNDEYNSMFLAAQLPTEILQQIFYLLTPVDFNSARRICRIWFISSLEPSTLKMMLRRGGWSTSMRHDLLVSQARNPKSRLNDIWIMSKRIAQECALGPDWTGNGISNNGELCAASRESGFVHNSTIDFTEVPVPRSEANTAGVIFTVSACRKFIMAANGCVVYIYELNRSYKGIGNNAAFPGSLRPVTSVICPRRVLACSMDTSSLRYAIAVLLDGRVGLVCDIDPSHICSVTVPQPFYHGLQDYSGEELLDGGISLGQPRSRASPVQDDSTHEPRGVFRGVATAVTSAPEDYMWHNAAGVYPPENIGVPTGGRQCAPFQSHTGEVSIQTGTASSQSKEQYNFTAAMPIETAPRTVYNNLCSDDDPPRSVAICPQRRCIAFGCAAGIELHWVDALTGQDLSRWFPLSSPSDYLFFLPPRVGIDSAKRLRLISSAARSGERPEFNYKKFTGVGRNSPYWNKNTTGEAHNSGARAERDTRLISRLRANTRNRPFTGRTDCSDHYRAIPLDDGYHVLFTDPATGLLCLGSDRPVGGPTKLLRKVWFQGPTGASNPVAYAGCMDPGSGVRVAAAYGSGSEQSVWFFSVPGDVFSANKGLPFVQGGSYTQAWSQGPGIDNRNSNWVDWWPDQGLHEWLDSVQDDIPEALPRTIWPVKIRGQKIGICPTAVDLTVHSGSSITVWAFSKDGLAKSWRLKDGNMAAVRNAWIARDGTVHDFYGGSKSNHSLGYSAWGPPFTSYTQRSFDGTSSTDPARPLTTHATQHTPPTAGKSQGEIGGTDGDLAMDKPFAPARIFTPEHYPRSQEVIKSVATLYGHEGKLYRSPRKSGYGYKSIGSDFAEGPTGLTRIDVEIR